jgi:hypothetical protein
VIRCGRRPSRACPGRSAVTKTGEISNVTSGENCSATHNLWRMQGIDLLSALMLALLAHPAGEHERMGEDALQRGVAFDLAHDVARDAAEIGSDRLQRLIGALELLGVGLALMGDQRMFPTRA